MVDRKELLELTKNVVKQSALDIIYQGDVDFLRKHEFDINLVREIKAAADITLEKNIISKLESTGIPILSEESGITGDVQDSDYIFIIDPLDGTFNFVRNFGACAISVALWFKGDPVFGVVYDLHREELYWGGKDIGAFCDNDGIKVSIISDIKKSLVCSGFPVRYDLSELHKDNYMEVLTKFAKVRMIGSAAISIISVSRGAAEAYFEKNIMIWDVAAGLAIAEGAGGAYDLLQTSIENSFDVIVSNHELFDHIKRIVVEH